MAARSIETWVLGYSDHTALAEALTNAYFHEELRLVSIRDL
jgi:muramoyltetrapeptide carboxypeptidase LdcA involved in peptidoglycan recycling